MFSRRIITGTLILGVLLFLVAWLTHLAIFPCQTFIWDSDQGLYNSICPIIDEDGESLIGGDYTSGFEPIPTFWTWVTMAVAFLGVPYGLSVLGNKWWGHRVARKI